jgi:hypothetical protein
MRAPSRRPVNWWAVPAPPRLLDAGDVGVDAPQHRRRGDDGEQSRQSSMTVIGGAAFGGAGNGAAGQPR